MPLARRHPLAYAAAAALCACSGEPPPPAAAPPPRAAAAPAAPAAPSSPYVLVDPDARPAGSVVALDEPGSFGALIDGARVVVGGDARAGPRVAAEIAPEPLTHVDRVPPWLGGGFLFRAGASLYTAATFDGALRPLAALPAPVRTVAFGPAGLLARGTNGERWHVAVPSGARLPIQPPGAVDLVAEANEHGKLAAALVEGGGVVISADGGASWQDARGRMPSAPRAVDLIEGAIWITDEQGRGHRVGAGGGLIAFDRPPTPAPKKLRPPDPRWRGREPPQRLAVRAGALVAPGTAVVAAGGDLAWIDLQTGAIRRLVTGVAPPDLPCEAVEVLAGDAGAPPGATPDDVLFVCASSGRPSVVISGVLAAGEPGDPAGERGERAAAPRIERTFATEGPFFAGDDGALAYGGPCGPPAGPGAAGAPPAARRGAPAGGAPAAAAGPPVACVRDGRGAWREVALEPDERPDDAADAGAPGGRAGAPAKPPGAADVRWIPRLERGPLALLLGAAPALHDTATGRAVALRADERAPDLERDLLQAARVERGGVIVDRRFSLAEEGAVRGWLPGGRSAAILPDGAVVDSPYRFPDAAASGPFAFARAPAPRDGAPAYAASARAFQTVDRGRTWAELAAPPAALGRSFQPRACGRAGCDLGPWLRLGWDAAPPAPAPEPRVAPRPPAMPAPALPALACAPAGPGRGAALDPTPFHPEDLDLGARRTPVSVDLPSGEVVRYTRQILSRGLVSPPHAFYADQETAPRALFHGHAIELDGSGDTRGPLAGLTVLGPNRNPTAFRREITFLEPLDPGGAIRAAGFGASALVQALRGTGAPVQDVLTSYLDALGVVPLLPADPAGPTDLFFALGPSDLGGIVGVVRGGAVELAWAPGVRGAPASAVVLPGAGGKPAAGRVVALFLDDDGGVHVHELTGGVMALIGELPPPPRADLYPANPDALAVGPQGALGVLRTPSGGAPPSAEDPALLLPLGGGPPVALAPWSTLASDADPACRADPGGYRAVVTALAPWVRAPGAPADPADAVGAMTARVRWSATRVCLEAIELPLAPNDRGNATIEPSLVARFSGTPAAAVIAVALGSERRDPRTCALTPP